MINEARRFDDNKLRLDLLPLEWQIELGRVFTFGACKYGANNWRKGMPFSKAVASAARHFIKWRLGYNYDEESGCHHLAHAAWNILALMSWQMGGLAQFDDRQVNTEYYNEDLQHKNEG